MLVVPKFQYFTARNQEDICLLFQNPPGTKICMRNSEAAPVSLDVACSNIAANKLCYALVGFSFWHVGMPICLHDSRLIDEYECVKLCVVTHVHSLAARHASCLLARAIGCVYRGNYFRRGIIVVACGSLQQARQNTFFGRDEPSVLRTIAGVACGSWTSHKALAVDITVVPVLSYISDFSSRFYFFSVLEEEGILATDVISPRVRRVISSSKILLRWQERS